MPTQRTPLLSWRTLLTIIGGQRRRIVRLVAEAFESLGPAIETVQPPAVGRDPEVSVPVDVETPDAIVAQTGGIAGIVLVVAKGAGGGVEPVQTAAVGADPDRTIGVLRTDF